MRRTTLLALMAIVLLALLSLDSQAQTETQSNAGSSASQAQAMKVVEDGIAALGGLDAMREIEDVQLKINGHSFARNQSLNVNPPYDKMTRDENLYIDLKNRKYIIETRDPLPGGFVFGGKQVITGNQGFFIDSRNKTVNPLNLTNFNNIGILRRLPHLFLMVAYETVPATLRSLGPQNYQGRPHDVITLASTNGIQWTAYLDARTHLLTKYEQLVSDNVMGDAMQETIFPAYRTLGKLKVPTGRLTVRAGDTIEEVNYVDVQFNVRPPESAFAKPADFEELPQPTPAATRETKLADGVYLFESASNSLLVEFKDFVMIIEPYVGGRGAKQTINKAREMFPNKPVKYVVVTHHHDDHSGGLRSYVAEGVTVVTTPQNESYFKKMASSNFTINRDDQTKNKKQPSFAFVQNKKMVVTDGNQTVEIIDIGPSPHATEMLVAYLPKDKLVFQGDLLNLPASGRYMPTTINDTTVHFFDVIGRLNLNVERIAAVHGPTTTLTDLRIAVEKKRSGQ